MQFKNSVTLIMSPVSAQGLPMEIASVISEVYASTREYDHSKDAEYIKKVIANRFPALIEMRRALEEYEIKERNDKN